jgi:amino acid transporter
VPCAVAITVVAAMQQGFDLDPATALVGLSWSDLARNTFIALGFFVGFDGIAALASEMKEPARSASKLLLYTVIIVGVTDILGSFFQAPLLLAHTADLDAGLTPTYVLMHATGLESMYVLVDVMLYMAELAGLIAWLNLSALIISTAGRDGFLPRALGDRHPRTGSPYKTVLLLTVLSVAIPVGLQLLSAQTLMISMAYVTNIVVLLWLVAYCCVCAATMTLHHRNGEAKGVAYLASALALVAMVGVIVGQALHPFDDTYALMNVLAFGLLAGTSVCLFLSKRHNEDALRLLAQ